MNIEIGALTIVGLVCMAWFVVQWIRIDNQILQKKEEWKDNPKWNWN